MLMCRSSAFCKNVRLHDGHGNRVPAPNAFADGSKIFSFGATTLDLIGISSNDLGPESTSPLIGISSNDLGPESPPELDLIGVSSNDLGPESVSPKSTVVS